MGIRVNKINTAAKIILDEAVLEEQGRTVSHQAVSGTVADGDIFQGWGGRADKNGAIGENVGAVRTGSGIVDRCIFHPAAGIVAAILEEDSTPLAGLGGGIGGGKGDWLGGCADSAQGAINR